MSLRPRQLSGRDVAAALVHFGFEVVATRGSHCKMRRILPSGERQTMTIPLHQRLAQGTMHAIYRQACRFIPETDLQSHFFSGEPPKRGPAPQRQQQAQKRSGQRARDKRLGRKRRTDE